MEASVTARLDDLERRLERIETLLRLGPVPVSPSAAATAPVAPLAPPREATPRREPRDLEELFGGRVLAWVGGLAVLLAAIFFLVMAVSNGWIGVTTRVVLAFVCSAALVALGGWLYERHGRTQAALAALGAGLAALYASDAAATLHYHLLSVPPGLAVAGIVGVMALVAAVRWDSQEVAALGIVGSLLAPVFLDAGPHTGSLVFMTIALLAAVGVVVERRWQWLAPAAYVVSVPQAADWLHAEHTTRLGPTIAVAAAFWLLYVVAALGHELRTPTETLRWSSASLLFVNASVAAAGGWWLIDDAGHRSGANGWLFGLACAHLLLGALVLRSRASREIGLLLHGVGAMVLGVALAVALNGPALVAAWSVEAVVLAWLGRRLGTPGRGVGAGLAFAGLGIAHVLAVDAQPDSLAHGLHSIPVALAAVALVLAALAGIGAAYPEFRVQLTWIGTGLAVYLASGLVVDLAGAHARHSTQTSQLALSGFWAALGFAALLAGLVRRNHDVRVAALGLLAIAVGKVFVVDLANLESIWRVASFLALGLLLLAGAFAYQRSRVALTHEHRETHGAV